MFKFTPNASTGERLYSVGLLTNASDENEVKATLAKLDKINERYAIVKIGGSVGVADLSTCPPDLLSETGFNTLFKNKMVSVQTQRGFKKETLAHLWMAWEHRREYDGGIVFAPGRTVPRNQLNLFQGFATEPHKGNWDRMERHLREVVCQGNEEHYEWLMSWFADILQNPGREKVGTAVVLCGKEGTGKSIIFRYFREMIGLQYGVEVSQKEHLVGRFNNHLASALFAQVEEAVWAGDKQAEGVLKHLITSERMPCEKKGLDRFEVDSYTRFAFTSNEKWVVPASAEARRFFVLEVSDEHMQNRGYFEALNVEMKNAGGLEAWMYALMNWVKPDWVDLRNPPKTDALGAQILESLPVEKRFFVEAIQAGRYFGDKRLSCWKSEIYPDYEEYVTKRGAKHAATEQRFGMALSAVWNFGDEHVSEKKRYLGKWDRLYWLPPLDEAREWVADNLNISADLLD